MSAIPEMSIAPIRVNGPWGNGILFAQDLFVQLKIVVFCTSIYLDYYDFL
jgi:hypothetical protein